MPWVWLAIAEALLLLVSPCYAFLEGTGLVAEVAQVRLATNILTSLALWLALSQGWALLASPIVTTVGVVSSSLWIAWRWRRFFIDLFRTRTKEVISWRLELWPFQWRVSITWLSYYFMSQVAIPVLFRYQGPVVAGQMGLSNSLVMAVLAVGLAWVSTKAPQFGVYVARRDFETLDRLFFRTLKQALSVLGLVSLGMFLAVLLADRFGSAYSRRILPPYLFLFLLGRMMVDCTAYFMSVYLRAHKQEPLLWVSLLNALLVGAATYIFGRFEGPRGVAIASFIAVLISLPVVVWIFNRKRRQWHTAPPVD